MAAVVWSGADGLRGLLVPVGELKPDPKNLRKHDERSYDAIKSSLVRFGQLKPVVARDGVVVAGNGTLEAAKRAGWSHLAVVGAEGLTEQEMRAFALVDNRSAELSGWDFPALATEAPGLVASFPDVDFGWSGRDLASFTAGQKTVDVGPHVRKIPVEPDELGLECPKCGFQLPAGK